MSNPVSIGLEGVVYLLSGTRATWSGSPNEDGIYSGAPPEGLSNVNVVRNVTLNLSASQADVSSRASVWKLLRKALKDGSVDFEIPWTPGDDNFQALLASYVNDSSVALAILDGPSTTAGSQGLWADFEVMEFTREEPIEKEMLAKVKVAPTASAVPPQWVEVADA
jgi:hypothetical protein